MKESATLKAVTTTQEPGRRHPIQVVARRTGLSADVIRVWERRYGVVDPERQSGGRRLYSDEDVKRLSLLQQVTRAGRRISEVAELDNATLLRLVNEDLQSERSVLVGSAAVSGADGHVKRALQAVVELDSEKLQRVLSSAAVELPVPVFLEQMLAVVLSNIGEMWVKGKLRVVHEHMASVVIKRFMVGMLGRDTGKGPLILLTTLFDQSHEIGALMAAVTAEAEGWRALYLGPDLPASEIVAAAIQTDASAVGLSFKTRIDPVRLSDELQQLGLGLPDSVGLIVGGEAIGEYRQQLAAIGAYMPQNLGDFREVLSRL